MFVVVLAISIFLFSYFFIITEKVPRSIVAVFGATLLIVFGVLNQETTIHHID